MKNFLLNASLGAVALVMSAGAASAQTEELISNPRGMVANFDAVNLGPVLTEMGIVWQERQTADGRPFIAASVGAQLSFNILPAACIGADGKSGCVGASVFTIFTGGNPNPQSVSAFNQKYAFISTGMFSDGSGAYLSRYEIADYGIPRGNVASSIYNFFVFAQRFRDEIATKTVSADGYADDMSAASLTISSAKSAGIELAADTGGTLAGIHQANLEAMPETIRVMMGAGNVPKNKISNITE